MTTGPGNNARWAHVTAIFSDALEHPPHERDAFVRREAGTDAALASDVLSLLQSHHKAGDFLERPPASHARPDPALLSPNQTIGHYRILGLLGAGGMGVVYLADDTRLGRTIALKAIAPALSGDAVRAARLRREARAAAALNHPGIATVYALEDIDGRLYIASEYVPGETLRDELARGPAPAARVRADGVALARALAAAHDRGIVHRDLKPENIVRAADGQLKVLDFGLAQFADDADGHTAITRDGGVIGTPAYMSPEQIRGDALDGRSDLFALGSILFEMLTGVHPFAAATTPATLARILQDRPTPPLAATTDDDARVLQQAITHCLEKSAGLRCMSAAALARALGGETIQTAPGPTANRRPAMWWWQFHQGAATLAYALLMVPLWKLRHAADGPAGMILFLLALVSVVVSGALRLHGWFGARQYHDDWRAHRALGRAGIVVADVVFAAVLLIVGLRVVGTDDRAASLLVAAAASVAVSLLIVEPATARAALGRD